MTNPIVIEHNTKMDEIREREMTAAEYKRFLADRAETEANATAFAAKEAARQAILTRLGLTAEEAALLLG